MDSNASSDMDDDDEWSEIMDDVSENVLCLFCSFMMKTAEDIFIHTSRQHDFDLRLIYEKLKLDTFSYIKMINYIRLKKPSAVDVLSIDADSLPWIDDIYMKPTIADDPLLLFDVESFAEASVATGDHATGSGYRDDASQSVPVEVYRNLSREHEECRGQLTHLQADLSRCLADLDRMKKVYHEAMMSQSGSHKELDRSVKSINLGEDSGYFSGYAHFAIHEEMLKDSVRTLAFRDFMYQNRDAFEDKTVLDVGCGTAILSMFAANAGARHVIAIDQSDIIYNAIDIVRENGLSDKITLVKGKLEETDVPVEKVDVIISEWMGYFLLYESMLETVIYARDHYLKPTGRVYPDRCVLYITAIDDAHIYDSRVSFWNDVYGFKMTSIRSEVVKEAAVDVVRPDHVIAQPCCLKSFDLMTCDPSEVEFTSQFSLVVCRVGRVTALVAYFDVFFEEGLASPVSISTSPAHTPTHWKQTVFHLPTHVAVAEGDVLAGSLTCAKMQNDARSLDVTIAIGDKLCRYSMP